MTWFAFSIVLPLAVLAAGALLLSLMRMACRSLPETHPMRSRVEAVSAWFRKSPRRTGVSVELVSTGLVLGYFVVLFVLYG